MTSGAPSGLGRLYQRVRRLGNPLLHQQCWLWGQDVLCPEGNLLLEYGFERQRAPDGSSGSSQYTRHTQTGDLVRLWGFGMYFGTLYDGIFLPRFEFGPREMRIGSEWTGPESVRGLPRSLKHDLAARAARWISDYESWVERCKGPAYRRSMIARWKEATSVTADPCIAWLSLSYLLDEYILAREIKRNLTVNALRFSVRSAHERHK